MVFQKLFIVAVAGLCLGKDHSSDGADVDTAIEHVEWHFNDKLCLDLLLVDCSKHVTQHDEQICGSDGKTYANHCKYIHAYCELAYSHNGPLSVSNHGPCTTPMPTTAAPATTVPAASTTAAPIVTSAGMTSSGVTNAPDTTAQSLATNPPTTAATTPAAVTTTPTAATITSPPTMTTTTTQGPTTTNPNHNIIQDVFCKNAAVISCAASGVDVICGTNGVLYPNQCEFAKAHCKIPSLSRDDPAKCASVGK